MEEVFIILKNLEKESQTLRKFIAHLQTNQVQTSLGCISTTQFQPKEPHINLPNKFDGTRLKLFKVLSTKCAWSFDFIFIGIQFP